MIDQQEQDDSQYAYHAHQQAMRQAEIEKAIRACELALQEWWMRRDEQEYGKLWGNQ